MRKWGLFLLTLLAGLELFAHDGTLPPGFAMEENFVTGLQQPTDLRIAPDGRIFIAEKPGTVRIVENGVLLSQPFYTVATQNVNERGLDGIILDPDFDQNGYVYLFHALPTENRNVVTRVTAAGNTAIPGSEVEIIRFDRMHSAFHNGGGMVFTPDGKLLIATGDGTGESPQVMHKLGKIHRVNPDGSIPQDNPFYNVLSGEYRSIAAYGLRNPYTMAISRLTGKIFINDVGNEAYEEVNEYAPGANFGWYPVEGPLGNNPAPDSNYVDPVFAYDHDYGCAIVGATFYEPDLPRFPTEYFGKYFFLDLCEGKLVCMDPSTYQTTEFGTGLTRHYSNLEASHDGYLYLINITDGNLARISYQGINAPPLISAHPQGQIVPIGDDVIFTVDATGEGATYSWYRNGSLMASQQTNSILLENVQLADDQTEIYVRVANANGSVVSNTALLTVVNGSRPNIQFRNIPGQYAAGDSIHFEAIASDPDQADIPPADWTWEIHFHHDAHYHPALSPSSGIEQGSFYVDTFGEVDTNVFYRVYLSVEDSTGLVTRDFVDIPPEKVTMNIESTPPGIPLVIDGAHVETDYPLRSVRNLNRYVGAAPWGAVGDTLYKFVRWGDGNDTLSRFFSARDTTLTLEYEALQPYFPYIQRIGNLTVFTDTASAREYYGEKEVPSIKENWDVLNPYWETDGSFPNDYFSAQWKGPVYAPVSDWYTFYLLHDGSCSLFIDDSLALTHTDNTFSFSEDTVRVWLTGGQEYEIRVEYDHLEYLARVELDWSYSVVERHNMPFTRMDPRPSLIEKGETMRLFPNPSTEEQVLLFFDPTKYEGRNFKLTILDTRGRVWKKFSKKPVQDLVTISVAGLPKGSYLFKIEAGVEVRVLRFLRL